MNYAIIKDGVVTNIIWLSPSTPFENAVPCGEYAVNIGDTYADGKFYRNGELIRSRREELEEALAILGVTE